LEFELMDFWKLDGKDRLARVARLIESTASDVERWTDPLNADGALDHSRSKRVAGIIPPGVSVLDLGCGAMALKEYLPATCTYHPADLVQRGSDCQVVDLNKGEFPVGRFDWVTMLGVLEYVFDVEGVLRSCRQAASHLVVDYNSQWLDASDRRRRCGWVNDLSPGTFADLAIRAGWKNIAMLKVVDDRYMYVLDAEVKRPTVEAALQALWSR
jgi:hypothetical protein